MKLWRWIWPALAVVAAVCIVLGVSRGEYEQVRRWANILCTACIGLGK
jgi:hypothetical protein